MYRIIGFVKKETVFCISALVAIISAIFVPVSMKYFSYINYGVIGLLFSLMASVAGFSSLGVFEYIASFLTSKTKSLNSLVFILWSICFFLSPVITNDVALITFVPLAILALRAVDEEKLIPCTVVLQTVAANLGGMLTPMGNPQNLLVYEKYELSVSEFIKITFPYFALSFILLLFTQLILVRNKKIMVMGKKNTTGNKKLLLMYSFLTILSVLSVLKFVDYRITALTVLVLMLIFDRKTLLKTDFFLLLTFIMFFIFVGNIAEIPQIREFIQTFARGREKELCILLSQFISNVPCCTMLSGFTDNYASLLTGCNIGGLGSLIASLASLISFKIYSESCENKGRYVAVFTGVNIAFLIILYLFSCFGMQSEFLLTKAFF